jgi:hypothetical protein
MKNIPANVWQVKLTEDDWNFGQIKRTTFEKREWLPCLRWELYREKVQAENGGSFPSALAFRPSANAARLTGMSPNFAGKVKKELNRSYEKPDWTPYLSGRKRAHWKPLPKLDYDNSSWISMDWHTLFRHWAEDMEFNATHLPTRTIMDGDGKTEILPFKIPWAWRDDEILATFAKWLKENRPRGEKGVMEICGQIVPWSDDRPRVDEPARPKGGAGSEIRQVKKILKALAGWRLIQHHKGDHNEALNHPGASKYLGSTYENNQSEWNDGRKTVETALRNHPFYFRS